MPLLDDECRRALRQVPEDVVPKDHFDAFAETDWKSEIDPGRFGLIIEVMKETRRLLDLAEKNGYVTITDKAADKSKDQTTSKQTNNAFDRLNKFHPN